MPTRIQPRPHRRLGPVLTYEGFKVINLAAYKVNSHQQHCITLLHLTVQIPRGESNRRPQLDTDGIIFPIRPPVRQGSKHMNGRTQGHLELHALTDQSSGFNICASTYRNLATASTGL